RRGIPWTCERSRGRGVRTPRRLRLQAPVPVQNAPASPLSSAGRLVFPASRSINDRARHTMFELVSLVNAPMRKWTLAEGETVMSARTKVAATRWKTARTQDPEGAKRNIIEVASAEFALNGLSGARIDEIADRTRFSKRMIYYYFGDKEGLYLTVLENAYRTVRDGEAKLDIDGLEPMDALRRLVEFTFDHHHRHEEFIRMVMIENIHHGEYLDRSKVI